MTPLQASDDSPSRQLEKKVSGWLETQGYPLEMYVARELQKRHFWTIQSEYYRDGESGDLREIDVTAHMQKRVGRLLFRLEFVIECKGSKEKPWVLFTDSGGLAKPASVAQRGASFLGRKALSGLAHNADAQHLAIFRMDGPTSYGITQAFGTGADIAYSAAMSVSKGAAGQIAEADEYTRLGHPLGLIVFPVIVVDAPLLEASLDTANNLHVRTVDQSILVWRNPVMHRLHNIITVLSRDRVTGFAEDMSKSCRDFFGLSGEVLGRIESALESIKLGDSVNEE